MVWRWRRALGVGREDTPGLRRLLQAARARGADATRDVALPPEQVEARWQRAIRLRLGDFLQHGYHGPWWTDEEIALLGTEPDEEVAKKVKRTANAVRVMRTRLGIATAHDKRFHPRRRRRA